MYAFVIEENSFDTKMALPCGNVVTVYISTIYHNSSLVIKGIKQGSGNTSTSLGVYDIINQLFITSCLQVSRQNYKQLLVCMCRPGG